MKHKARSKMIQQSIRRHRCICTIEEKVLCTETVSRGWLSIRKVGHTKTYSASHMYVHQEKPSGLTSDNLSIILLSKIMDR